MAKKEGFCRDEFIKNVTTRLPQWLNNDLEKYCDDIGVNKSVFIRLLIECAVYRASSYRSMFETLVRFRDRLDVELTELKPYEKERKA